MTSLEKESNEDLSDNSDNNVVNNKFANDGSFLELFQKMQKQLMEDKNKSIDNNSQHSFIQTDQSSANQEKSLESSTTTTSNINKTTNLLPTSTTKTSSTVRTI